MSNKQFNGFFSEYAALRFGYAIWSRPDGSQVKITEVCETGKKPTSEWADLECVGPVINCVQINHKALEHQRRMKEMSIGAYARQRLREIKCEQN